MSLAAGAKILVDDVRHRVATTIVTVASAALTTTETVVATVSGSLISGKTYKVSFAGGFTMSAVTTGDHGFARVREDTLTGTQIQGRRMSATTAASAYPLNIEVEYTAGSTASKTFVVTMVRAAGTTTVTNYAASDQPGYFYIDYVRG